MDFTIVGILGVITFAFAWGSFRVIRSQWHKIAKVIILTVISPLTVFSAVTTAVAVSEAQSPESVARREAKAERREADRTAKEARKAAQKASEEAAKAIEEAENRRKGFHCLSAWDGSHPEFKRAVKEMMRNPKSFEHVETRVTPVSDGRHTIMMTYRSENGFGGMTVGEALGSYSNVDCSYSLLSVE